MSSIITMNFIFFIVNNEAIGFGTIPILCLNISVAKFSDRQFFESQNLPVFQ